MLARWWRLVAFMKATNLIHWAMRTVLYRHIAMTIETASKVDAFLHRCFVDCRLLGGRRGDSERVVARWRRPVASGEALVMLHRVMSSVWLQCI